MHCGSRSVVAIVYTNVSQADYARIGGGDGPSLVRVPAYGAEPGHVDWCAQRQRESFLGLELGGWHTRV